ncbi:MAG: nuclear transport factor 2 family protein [Rhodomicrobium sp.]|nr:nuclear transport factor 2 family protein [Rhodomicrobium sp.]
MDNPYQEILDILAVYFDGLYFSDAERLTEAFHPDARYVCASDDPLLQLGMDAYLPLVAKRASPASRGETRRDAVESIAFAGPNAAVARVRCAIGQKLFTDILTLVRADGRWRIISKVFHYDLMDPK